MGSGLAACGQCGRHVRTSESACPFCRAARRSDPGAARGARSLREIAGARASRAALFAGAVIVAGCGGGDDDGGGIAQPAYGGAPPTETSDAGSGGDGGVVKNDAGTPIAQPVYGAPVHEDGG